MTKRTNAVTKEQREKMRESILDAVMVKAIPDEMADAIIDLISGTSGKARVESPASAERELMLELIDGELQCASDQMAMDQMKLMDPTNIKGDIPTDPEWAMTRHALLMKIRAFILASPASTDEPIQIIFDGPPGPEGGRFVEVEQGGYSINFGEWKDQENGYWVLEFHLASPVFPKVSRKEIREWANRMTNAADYYKSLTTDQFIALYEGAENYLAARLQEKGIEVEKEKP